MIPLSVPHISGNEWKYIKECLDSEWVSSAGTYVERFEQDICRYTDSKYAVACVNGTAALHIALLLADVHPDDEVIVPTLTFIAPINAVRYVKAVPVFMDCDDFYNIDVEKTTRFIKEETRFKDGWSYNRKTGRRITAVIPVHVYGNGVDLIEFALLCRERNIKLIEDATESLGTVYAGGALDRRHTGTIGGIGCFSFNGNKIITTGGGGMIVTDDAEYADRAKYLTTQAKDDPAEYIHDSIGYNYRLTNIQAAMGVAQLERLPEFIAIKEKNYYIYKREIDGIDGLSLAGTPDYCRPNHWMYCLRVDAGAYGRDRDGLRRRMSEEGIETRPVWQLNHLQKPYMNCQAYRIDHAHGLRRITLNIPCSVNLDPGDIQKVVSVCKTSKNSS